MLTKNREIVTRDLAFVAHPVAAGVVIYQGALVVLNPAGYAQPGTSATNLTVVGKATCKIDNSAGNDGDTNITCRVDLAFRYDNDPVAPIDRTHIMSDCYIKDDVTVSNDNTGRSRAGRVVDVDADGVWITII